MYLNSWYNKHISLKHEICILLMHVNFMYTLLMFVLYLFKLYSYNLLYTVIIIQGIFKLINQSVIPFISFFH